MEDKIERITEKNTEENEETTKSNVVKMAK